MKMLKQNPFKWTLLALPFLPMAVLADIIPSDQVTQDALKAESSVTPVPEMSAEDKAKLKPVKGMLPDQFKVYYNDKMGFSTKSFKGSQEKIIPTNNEYREQPGCYLACVSKSSKDAAFHVLDNVYMMGQMRVKGRYMNGMCIPAGYESKDARNSKELKDQCQKAFPEKCDKGSCFIETRTGSWAL
jgi:hypothetical protein